MEGIVEATGIYLATLIVGVLSGLVPVINGELFLIGAIKLLADDLPGAIVVAVLMALGQMIAKIILYHAALKTTELGRGKLADKLRAARERIEKWRSKPLAVLAASASLGLPPFYLVTLAAGVLQIRFVTFLWIGIVGRVVRFVAIALLVHLA